MRRAHKFMKASVRVLAMILCVEVTLTFSFYIFAANSTVTPHHVPNSERAVVIAVGLNNVGDIAAAGIAKRLAKHGINVFVINYAWTNIDTRRIYRALRTAINERNRLEGAKKIRRISIHGSSFGGGVAYELGGLFLEDGLPYGKLGLTLDGSLCTREQVRIPAAVIDNAPLAKSSVILTLGKAIPSYLQTSQALDDVEPGISKVLLYWHHINMALYPAIGTAAEVERIRDFIPDPRAADAFDRTFFIKTPGDPLVDNEASASCWKKIIPELQIVKAGWKAGKHAPLAEQPTLETNYAMLGFAA